jgi:SAM-dependent methyltransferase
MPSPALHDYDRVAYPSMAHPQTFTDNLALKGFVRGMNVAPPDRCRVLELGAGDGFNLAAMAMLHPDSTYVGIDYAADAVARGRKMLAELDLTQVRLEEGDIRSLDPALGEFDYIIAHGVYSWVPYEVRDALLQALAKHLAPQGVGFISYMALPGSFMRETVRTIMRFHSRSATDVAEKARHARSILKLAASAPIEENLYTKLLEGEWKVIEAHSDEGLFHDELSEISAPLLFTDFLEHASRHHLVFLSEAEYHLPFGRLQDAAREQLRPLEQNRVMLEQYMDFIDGRRFRQTLLVRPGQGESMTFDRMDSLYVRLPAEKSSGSDDLNSPEPIEYRGLKRSGLRAKTPLEKAVTLELSTWRREFRPFPALLKAVRERFAAAGLTPDSDHERTIRKYVLQSNVAGLVELAQKPSLAAHRIPERPRTTSLALWQITHGHAALVSLAGKFVEVEGLLGKFLFSLLDGTRDRAALLAEVRSFLTMVHAKAREAGQPALNLPDPDAPDLAAQLERSLQGLTELELIYAD